MVTVRSKLAICGAVCASLISCGGGSGGTLSGGAGTTTAAASNVASVVVDGGPVNNTINTLYTSVTVCVPGSTTCQTIDHVQVDTGSVGLRILASALTLSLPLQTASDGNSLVECTVFADGYIWGPIATLDLQIAGESAHSLPVQIVGDARFPTVPANCSGAGPDNNEDTVEAFGANGLLGIGVFAQDCGSGCATAGESESYYSCSTACQPTTVLLANQVPNPVLMFAADNNGSIIQMPSVASQGAATLTGSLIFGVDTRSNNASGSETVLTVDPDSGYLTATFDGQSLSQSFIDSGSNGIYFDDAGLPACTQSGLTEFYCPAATENLAVTLQGANGVTAAVDFSVGNAETLGSDNPTFTVFATLGGTDPVSNSFDFGLPFFFGRRVATVVESQTTTVGTGPYIAF